MDYQKYLKLKKQRYSEKTKRIFTELDFAAQLNKVNGNFFSDVLDNVVTHLGGLNEITFKDILYCEKLLSELGKLAKKQQVICIAHAHIDINWLWGFDETTDITLSTIDTMLALLDKYENFTFAQSSALVYKIIEDYRPDYLERIKKYVKEGRFEITASTFIEADKNLPNGNSLIRQHEYAKKYLSNLFELPEDYFCIDFEPDTFGHTAYEPEILSFCGVKYLYHCRGNECPPVYRWTAPSGKSILVYREPFWYNGAITDDNFTYVPDFCKRYGVEKTLKVYGVGDHGGGASIRDIEKLIELSSYPIMPDIKFGTYREYFDYLSTLKNIPEIRGEQSQIFSGCYSSQSEIKLKNEIAETAVYEQELFCSLDVSNKYDNSKAVECILTNQFHDAITGSGIDATMQFALGRYQEALAQLGAFKGRAIRAICDGIDTAKIYNVTADVKDDTAFGAGVGFGAESVNFGNYIAYGKERAYTVFNQLNFERSARVILPLWDYYGDVAKLAVYDEDGAPLPFSVKSEQSEFYWSHNYHVFEALITLPPLSYRTIILREKEQALPEICYPPLYQRTEAPSADFTLENNKIKAVFDRNTFELISLYDKKNKKEKLTGKSGFYLFNEDTTEQMTAWYVGRFKDKKNLHENVSAVPASFINNDIKSSFAYKTDFGNSTITVTVTLGKESDGLDFEADVNFLEAGDSFKGIPDLRFVARTADADTVICDVPLGVITRNSTDRDVPCYSFACTDGLMLVAKGKHGFRSYNGELSVCLLRASCDPHPLPEYGRHKIKFGLYLGDGSNTELLHKSENFRISPVTVSVAPHKGKLPLQGKFKEISDNVIAVSVNSERTVLFNAEDTPVQIKADGKKHTVPPHSLYKI